METNLTGYAKAMAGKSKVYDEFFDVYSGDDMINITDEVNCPAHYVDMAIAPSDFIYDNKLDFFTGNAIKYICRASKKNGKQDLEKAIKYIQMRIEKEYN